MKRRIVALAICVGAALAFPAPALADEGKDGKGWSGDYDNRGDWRDYGGYEDRGDWRGDYSYEKGPRRYRKQAEIPYGHLPPPGECRYWYPDLPPGHQPPPHRC